MENINDLLSTIPEKRKKQYEKILHNILTMTNHDGQKEEIIKHTKNQIIQFMQNEEEEKIEKRKHWSKWKKHKERWSIYIQSIEERLYKYWLDFPLLFKELFNVDLKEKNGPNGLWYIWLCPLHEENTPSLSISPTKWVIKCYWCGCWWTITNFFCKVLNKEYPQIIGLIEKYILTPEQYKTLKWKNIKQIPLRWSKWRKDNSPEEKNKSYNDVDDLPF